ncbi:MAG: hypothetical protein K6G18_06485 [Treponema sp.]|nr:hypothetical protein [Treponema sp.]
MKLFLKNIVITAVATSIILAASSCTDQFYDYSEDSEGSSTLLPYTENSGIANGMTGSTQTTGQQDQPAEGNGYPAPVAQNSATGSQQTAGEGQGIASQEGSPNTQSTASGNSNAGGSTSGSGIPSSSGSSAGGSSSESTSTDTAGSGASGSSGSCGNIPGSSGSTTGIPSRGSSAGGSTSGTSTDTAGSGASGSSGSSGNISGSSGSTTGIPSRGSSAGGSSSSTAGGSSSSGSSDADEGVKNVSNRDLSALLGTYENLSFETLSTMKVGLDITVEEDFESGSGELFVNERTNQWENGNNVTAWVTRVNRKTGYCIISLEQYFNYQLKRQNGSQFTITNATLLEDVADEEAFKAARPITNR